MLLVSAWYPAPHEPANGIFVRDQARAVALRCNVTVLARTASGAPRDSIEDGVRVMRVLPASGTGLIAGVRWLAAMTSAMRQMRREGHPVDLVHGHVVWAAFLAVLAGRLHGLPAVVSEHFTGMIDGRLSLRDRLIARFTFRYADLVCPVSELLEQSLVRLQPRGRYLVMPNTVDVDAFTSLSRPESVRSGSRLLTVAGLFAQKKGILYLLEALRLLLRQYSDARLDLVGDGPDRDALESAARDLPVAFLGERSREDIAGLMQDADVLVMPSLVETFGIAPLEGLAAGLPVVATSAYPLADVITDLGGVVVPPGDSVALSEGIAFVLAGRSSVRSDAAAELRHKFGLEATGRRWEAIYRSLVDARGATRHS